ncbi:MAG: GxxExxY protein [Akkermansiaceae bacterium]|nr:GxxExxY protein [Akkermansiaceae bacterium]
MDANGRELILKDEVYAIISCAFEVINGLGHGLHEKPYENALAVEFRHRGIPFTQQPKFPVVWRDVLVGEFIPDLIVHEQIIVDAKTIERITQVERGQMLNYLRITRLPVGLMINFKKSKLEWERIVLSH